MVSALLLISKFSSPFNKPLVIIPSTPITIGINVTFLFHSFFSSLAKSKYLSLFSLSFIFTLRSHRTVKSTILLVLFLLLLLLTITRTGLPAGIRWSVFDGFWLMHIPFVYVVIFNFLHHSKLITSFTQSSLVLQFFAPFCCNRLSYNWSFRLYRHINNIFSKEL